jgi:ketosteroid isomerase-like protein
MPSPKDLTGRFMTAYNERDREALRALLAPELEYVRPGGGTLRTADEAMAQYERDWAVMSISSVEVRELFESGDGILAEITIRATINGRSVAVEAALAHRWRGGKLVNYRLYSDPLPVEVAAVQPARAASAGPTG